MKWLHEVNSSNLANRKKGVRIDPEMVKELKMIIKKYPGDHKLIRKTCRLSVSIFRRIRKQAEGDAENMKVNNDSKLCKYGLTEDDDIIIKDIVTPPKPPLTIKSIHEEFMKRSENWQSMSKIRRYLKEEMKYSYRTG